jgi:hypothetical protein
MAVAKKTTNGDGLSAAVEQMAKGHQTILDRIAQRKITRSALIKRQPSIPEQIQESDDAVDSLAASYDPPPHELLSPGITDGRLVDLTKPVGATLAFLFPDVLKKKLADRIRTQATGDEMPTAEKARELAKLDEEDLKDWREFEAGVVAAERHGLRIPRPADMPVEVFLEIDLNSSVVNSLEKVKTLERRRDARRGEQDEFHRERSRILQEQTKIEQEIYELESLPRRPYGTSEVIEGQRKLLEGLGKELADLNERNTQREKEYSADAKLLSRVHDFLKKRGVGPKPGTVNLTTG